MKLKNFKPMMFAILAGLPLAVLPAMAESTSPTTGAASPSVNTQSTTTTSDGRVYTQSSTHTPNAGMGPAGSPGNVQKGGESGGSGSK
jgi:hypothetical protein